MSLGFTPKWLCIPPSPPIANSMSAISLLLLTRFWPNIKDILLGSSLTDANCHDDIFLGDICQYREYLSCYWPLRLTKLSHWQPKQHLSWQYLSKSGISKLLLTQLWPNFEDRFLGPSITDVNYHRDIYLGNISRGKHAKSLFVSAQIFLHVQQKIQLFFLVFLWGIFSQSLMLSKSFPERYWKNGNFGEYLWKSWFPYWENGVFELCRTTTI